MAKRRMYISVGLMILAIVAIVAFQCYWLYKNFKDERQTLRIRTNVMFREALYQTQADKMHLDSNVHIRYAVPRAGGHAGSGASYFTAGFTNVLFSRIRDSFPGDPGQVKSIMVTSPGMFISHDSLLQRGNRSDSTHIAINVASAQAMPKLPGDFLQVLKAVESPKDSVKVAEATEKYKSLIKKENISLPFFITRLDTLHHDPPAFPDLEKSNEITLGFNYPVTYRLNLENTAGYLVKKLYPQILVSVLLVGLTILSFFLLLRNLIQQQKLTQLKNDFISNITHELKTPIATVSVAIEALKNFNALNDPVRTQEYLDISGNELQRLSLLADKVLKLSMFEKQQIELRPETFDARQLAEEVIGSMRLQFEKYRAQVTVQSQGENFTLKADRMHITSVLFNLLDNALKYSKAIPSILVELTGRANEIEIAVTDNGIGIPPEYRKKIFDKFFRVPTGDTHNVKGYGLGLSYVAYVVQKHNGVMEVESKPGIGSRFIIKLSKTA